jgi:hypothetical protein
MNLKNDDIGVTLLPDILASSIRENMSCYCNNPFLIHLCVCLYIITCHGYHVVVSWDLLPVGGVYLAILKLNSWITPVYIYVLFYAVDTMMLSGILAHSSIRRRFFYHSNNPFVIHLYLYVLMYSMDTTMLSGILASSSIKRSNCWYSNNLFLIHLSSYVLVLFCAMDITL